MKAVLSIFSPIVRLSPPLGQMRPNMERDVRKGHRAKICEDSWQCFVVKQRKWWENVWFLNATTLEIKRKESASIRFLLMGLALEWCPFLTSELKKCQISDASHWLVPNEPTRPKFVQRGL